MAQKKYPLKVIADLVAVFGYDIAEYTPAQLEVLVRNIDNAKLFKETDPICQDGLLTIFTSGCKSWEEYFTQQWSNSDFRDWARSSFKQVCEHCQAETNPLATAFSMQYTYARFKKENPNFDYGKWPVK